MIYITRKEHFNAAHRLFRPDFDDARNMEVFGKCSNPNWHGHNYDLYVTVKGHVNPETGFLINLKELSRIINFFVVDKLDHKNVNLEVDFMAGKLASSENLAIAIWEQIETPILKAGAQLHCVKLFETERNFVEYYGTQTN
ncbi:MAG: 6-pyruvoyl tetrahydrobiopterin synthase [Bacteroidetes bacterium HGW-Bacteroidetes-11]|jgi:6-pyruvoyltetrahydropterin/6-carboxytetrahydropterin synthase|nr:MAG: 6-pyruvoyl tetrahydrobiopterin synthase [Bacteroidetes bacterium HGW-Bacteroidetes-11]